MKEKLRFLRVQELELELDLADYPDGFTIEQAAAYELENGNVKLLLESAGEESYHYEVLNQHPVQETIGEEMSEKTSLQFTPGSFVERGNGYFQILTNEEDFAGTALDMRGNLIDPFYFQYNGMHSKLVTDPALQEQLGRLLAAYHVQTEISGERLSAVGFQCNHYPEGNYYELNVRDFDRATEIAELAGVKFDKRSGIHHVILQCDEKLTRFFFFCEDEYWEMTREAFAELVGKL